MTNSIKIFWSLCHQTIAQAEHTPVLTGKPSNCSGHSASPVFCALAQLKVGKICKNTVSVNSAQAYYLKPPKLR